MKSLQIFKYIVKLWFSEITSLLNNSAKKLIALFSLVFFIGAFSYLSFIFMGKFFSILFELNDKSLFDNMFYSESLFISLIVFAIYIFIKTITSDQNMLDWQLCWMPVAKNQVLIAYYLLHYLLISIISILLVVLIYFPSFIYYGGLSFILVQLIANGLLQTLIMFILFTAIYNSLYFIFNIIKLAGAKYVSSLILIILFVVYIVTSIDIFGFKPENNILSYSSFLFYKNLSYGNINMIFIGMVILLLLVLFGFSLFSKGNNHYASNSIDILKAVPVSKNYIINIFILQLKYMIRNIEILINLVLTFIILIASFFIENIIPVYILLLMFYAFSTAMHAMYSYGNERKFDYVYKLANKDNIKINIYRLLSCTILTVILFMIYYLLTFRHYYFIQTFILGISLAIGSSIILYAIGMIVVVEYEKPLNSFISIILFIFISCIYFSLNYFLFTKVSFATYSLANIILLIILFDFFILATNNKMKELKL